jgi:hypothetical protein
LVDSLSSSVNGLHEIDDGTQGGYGWDDLIAAASRSEGHRITPVFMPRAAMLAIASVAGAFSKAAPITPDKVRELYHENWVAQGALSPEKPVTFAEGFAKTIAWYREQGWLPKRAGVDTRQAHNKQGEPAA